MSFVEKNGPIKKVKIDLTSSGDLVAAVTGKAIRVLSIALTVTTANGTIKFQSGATTDLTGAMGFSANGQLILPHQPAGWMDTASAEKLNAVLSSTGQVSGTLVYQEVLAG